jgi:hypothetical protein
MRLGGRAFPLGESRTKSLKTIGGRREIISQEERTQSRRFFRSVNLEM